MAKKDPISLMDSNEFVEHVARDCIANMSEEDKQCFREDKDPDSYHFGYGMYIRNKYIHGKDLPLFVPQPDMLSELIIEKIIDIINSDNIEK